MELYVQYKDYNWMMSFTEKLLERICIAVNGSEETTIDGKTLHGAKAAEKAAGGRPDF